MGGKDKPAPATTGVGTLGALLAARGVKAPDPASLPPAEAAPVAAPEAGLRWSAVPRVVLEMQKKGRAGKVVTVLRGVPSEHAEDASRQLRKAMGVGVGVEEDEIVVQGDQRVRLRAWLSNAGVRQVTG